MSQKKKIVNVVPNNDAARQADRQQINNSFNNIDTHMRSYETGIEDVPHTNIDLNRQTNISSDTDVAVSENHFEGAGMTFIYGMIDYNKLSNVETCFPVDKKEAHNIHNFGVINENKSVIGGEYI